MTIAPHSLIFCWHILGHLALVMNQLHPYKSSVSIYRSSRFVSRWSWWYLCASHCFWSVARRFAYVRHAAASQVDSCWSWRGNATWWICFWLHACACTVCVLTFNLLTRSQTCLIYFQSILWLLKPIFLCIRICKCPPVSLYHDKLAIHPSDWASGSAWTLTCMKVRVFCDGYVLVLFNI